MREHAHHFRVFCGERRNRGLCDGEGGIRTPETLSSLHAFQACALNRARPPLRARIAIMHHALARGHRRDSATQSDTPPGTNENAAVRESASLTFGGLVPSAELDSVS